MENVKKKAGNKPVNKSTKVIFDERVSVVTEMLLSGLRRKDIIQNIYKSDNLKWKVGDRQIDQYIGVATMEILEQYKNDRANIISSIYSKYNFLYKKMVLMKDYRGAAAIVDKLCLFVPMKELAWQSDTEDTEIRQPVIVNITGRPQMHHYEETIDSQDVTVIANQRLIS